MSCLCRKTGKTNSASWGRPPGRVHLLLLHRPVRAMLSLIGKPHLITLKPPLLFC